MLKTLLDGALAALARVFCKHHWIVVGVNPDGTVLEACRHCWDDRTFVP